VRKLFLSAQGQLNFPESSRALLMHAKDTFQHVKNHAPPDSNWKKNFSRRVPHTKDSISKRRRFPAQKESSSPINFSLTAPTRIYIYTQKQYAALVNISICADRFVSLGHFTSPQIRKETWQTLLNDHLMHCILATLFVRERTAALKPHRSARLMGKCCCTQSGSIGCKLLQFKEGTSDGLTCNFKYK
jgi:hypothetical protein